MSMVNTDMLSGQFEVYERSGNSIMIQYISGSGVLQDNTLIITHGEKQYKLDPPITFVQYYTSSSGVQEWNGGMGPKSSASGNYYIATDTHQFLVYYSGYGYLLDPTKTNGCYCKIIPGSGSVSFDADLVAGETITIQVYDGKETEVYAETEVNERTYEKRQAEQISGFNQTVTLKSGQTTYVSGTTKRENLFVFQGTLEEPYVQESGAVIISYNDVDYKLEAPIYFEEYRETRADQYSETYYLTTSNQPRRYKDSDPQAGVYIDERVFPHVVYMNMNIGYFPVTTYVGIKSDSWSDFFGKTSSAKVTISGCKYEPPVMTTRLLADEVYQLNGSQEIIVAYKTSIWVSGWLEDDYTQETKNLQLTNGTETIEVAAPITYLGYVMYNDELVPTSSIVYGEYPPADPTENSAANAYFWIDTNDDPHVLKQFDGTGWVAAENADLRVRIVPAVEWTQVPFDAGDTITISDAGKSKDDESEDEPIPVPEPEPETDPFADKPYYWVPCQKGEIYEITYLQKGGLEYPFLVIVRNSDMEIMQNEDMISQPEGMTQTSKIFVTIEEGGSYLFVYDQPEDQPPTINKVTEENRQILLQNSLTQIDYRADIEAIYNGTEEAVGLYEMMETAVLLAADIADKYEELKDLQEDQLNVEAAFSNAMGDMLKDGYWSDQNYAEDQKELLYYDAVERMEQLSKPQVRYTLSWVGMSEYLGGTEKIPDINAKVRIADEDLSINDIAYVTKRTVYLDAPQKGNIEISNDGLIAASPKSFEAVLSKVTSAADRIEQRNRLYERATAITANGKFPVERITGALNIQDSGIRSPKSNWHTDADGAMVFESALSNNAYKISGDGIMYAKEKVNGEWKWELFGNGLGFDASALSSGSIMGSSIADGTIGAGKLSDALWSRVNNSLTAEQAEALYITQQMLYENTIEIGDLITNGIICDGKTLSFDTVTINGNSYKIVTWNEGEV